MKRRHFILMLGGSSASAMTIGSGAFSSAQMERGMDVNVVDDESALVGYDNSSNSDGKKPVTDGQRVDLVTVENRFAGEVRLSVPELSVIPNSGEYPDIDGDSLEFPDDLAPGDDGTISGVAECDGHDERATVEVTVRVEGGGVSAEVFGDTETRRFDIICAEMTTFTAASNVGFDGVEFNGSGNAEVLSPHDGEVDVQVYYVDDDGVEVTDPERVSVGENLRGNTSIGSETIVGVHVKEVDGVFVHPQFDPDECDVAPDNGGGNGSENGNGVSGGEVTQTVALEGDPFGEDCLASDDD